MADDQQPVAPDAPWLILQKKVSFFSSFFFFLPVFFV